MSRLFIETVQGFGYEGYHDYDSPARNEVLFCGLMNKLTMPSFRIKLRGPTSTSTQVQVAQNFAKRDGVILELTHYYEKRFDVSWLSRYAEEQERILVHGRYPMKLSSVRLINEQDIWVNYEVFADVLFHLNKACTGTILRDEHRLQTKKTY